MSARRTDSGLDGILLVDKSAGWTSHDVVAKARGIVGQRKIGHTGTLDPMATGLLVLCLGQATRLVEYLTGHDKRYTGTIQLGARTSTDDAEGEVLERRAVRPVTGQELDRVLDAFRGEILQRPPAYSALKIDGQRAYDLARRGDAPELAARPVTIRRFDAAMLAADTVTIDVTCSSGTYIRSLARDVGEALGCGAHLSALRRHRAGPFSVEDAVSLDVLTTLVANGAMEEVLLPADEGIADLDAALLCSEGAGIIAHGGWWKSDEPFARSAETVRIYADSGEFIGVGNVSSSGEIRPKKVFVRSKS